MGALDLPSWMNSASASAGGAGNPDRTFATLQDLSGPAYARTNAAPSWLPAPNTSELSTQLATTGKDYDTNPFDTASQTQQSRTLTTALNAGNNAATEYANKARQAGGSGMGGGLVKAEAAVGAQGAAGDMELKRQQFDADMRDKAATHATAIATTLAGLRNDYLKTLVGYATSEDQISASNRQTALEAAKAQTAAAAAGSAGKSSWFGFIPSSPGGGGYAYNAAAGVSSTQGSDGAWTPQSWGG